MSDSEVETVLMTAPSEDEALALARRLVEERLAACGTVLGGVRSVYRWEGRVEEEPEALVVLKTARSRIPGLLERAKELHPYEVPELLVLSARDGLSSYLEWVRESVAREET